MVMILLIARSGSTTGLGARKVAGAGHIASGRRRDSVVDSGFRFRGRRHRQGGAGTGVARGAPHACEEITMRRHRSAIAFLGRVPKAQSVACKLNSSADREAKCLPGGLLTLRNATGFHRFRARGPLVATTQLSEEHLAVARGLSRPGSCTAHPGDRLAGDSTGGTDCVTLVPRTRRHRARFSNLPSGAWLRPDPVLAGDLEIAIA